jgi:AI-2 transport protein TqsA
MQKINLEIKIYLRIKTFVSFLTAILSWIVLKIIGVDFAEFWALLIFVLNYIPTIGSIIAVLFPISFTFIQFSPSLSQFAIVAVLLITIQFVIGNILDPYLSGQSLNLSPFVVFLSLGLWGKIWGPLGMFLCVPLTVIISIILAKFSQTRPIAVLLSGNGKVDRD